MSACKRKTLAELAFELRRQLAVGDDIEIVVVLSTTDGELVGVSANVPKERAEAIMRAACTDCEHVDHPDIVEGTEDA